MKWNQPQNNFFFFDNPEFRYKIHSLIDSSKEKGLGKKRRFKNLVLTFQLLPVSLARFSKVEWIGAHAVSAAVWLRHVSPQLPLHPLPLPRRSGGGWSCPRAAGGVGSLTPLSCVHILSHCSSPWPYSNPVHDWVLILYKYFETYL